MSVLNSLPLTRYKIFIARILYRCLSAVGTKKMRLTERGGVKYELDLGEGIDLNIFLFGSFQKHVFQNQHMSIKEGWTVIDVGANIGAMTLAFAKLVGNKGKVIAFEPTDYAYKRLLRNISLNSALAPVINVNKCFVSTHDTMRSDMKAFSSWRLDSNDKDIHPVHLGKVMEASETPSVSLDSFISEHKLSRVDLLKIDTDGYELEVLKGSSELLKKFGPYVIFECGQYVLRERGQTLDDFVALFENYNYELFNSQNGMKLTAKNIANEVPLLSTIDIIAVPKRKTI